MNTYVALRTEILTSTSSSVIFSSIPQTYTDLVIVISAKNTTGQNYETYIRFNNDSTSTLYSQTFLQNYAGSVQSGRNTGINQITPGKMNTTSFDVNIINILNYSNTTTNKTVLSRLNNAAFVTGSLVGLWRNNNAITQIELLTEPGTSYTAGSTFTLYGIASAQISAPKAFGGIITKDSTYTYHTFGASGTFTPQQSLTVDCLVIGGGGGGGCAGGGGGAGSLIHRTGFSLSATNYSITIGTGGAGDTTRTSAAAASGTASTFNGISATGGGGGASNNGAIGGGAGGSGGGAVNDGNAGTASAGTLNGGTGYVNIGGGGVIGGNVGQGGGGAGAPGGTQNPPSGGLGGNGSNLFASWLLPTGMGVAGYIAAGGAGYTDWVNPGGLGGGGASGIGGNNGSNGVVNTGSGAGGARNASSGNGGNGGSGLVIIRYAN